VPMNEVKEGLDNGKINHPHTLAAFWYGKTYL